MATESKRFTTAIVIALVIGVLLGFMLRGITQSFADDGRVVERSGSPVDDSPTTEANDVPGEFSRTQEGAVVAAAEFTLLPARDRLAEEAELVEATSNLATPEWRPQAESQARKGHAFVADRYGAPAHVAGAVIGYDVVDFSPDQATVDLWAVTIASGPRRPRGEEMWSLVTVELEWLDNGWRVARSTSRPGPSPVDLPSNAPSDSVEEVMEGFSEFVGPTAL